MNIVQQAAEKISQEMLEQFVGIQNHDVNFSELVANIQSCVHEIGVSMIETLIIEADSALRQSPTRKREWHIQRNEDSKSCATTLGPVEIKHTYFKHKKDGHFSYLLDEYLDILPYERMDIGLESQILETASERSYQQTVKQFQHSGITSKETVKNIIHRLETEKLNVPGNTKASTPKVLFIEADEDHVAYQDGKNRFMKLVYVHEGYEENQGTNSRTKLKNIHYFSGLYSDNYCLWEEVSSYLAVTYDLNKVEKIYLSGDGAAWIKEGVETIPNALFVLDRFHMIKYVRNSCTGMMNCTSTLLGWIDHGHKLFVQEFFSSRLSDKKITKSQRKQLKQAKSYLLGNWQAIQRQQNRDYIGCSAEGHVSHVLSARLSSRPLGWSKVGANNIAKMRVFLKNQGNLMVHLELRNKKIQKKSRINKLDKRVNSPKILIDQSFLATLPVLKDGRATGSKTKIKKMIDY
ncbi:ISLre2 family transposase [Enterococcus sp. DIV0170]|uniref:ISLre2 family transposase n=1 Tax=Enterococcus sp. DIV0170 TaxID=2774642 RepID=UPI003F28B2CC